ncbi:MAG: glutamine-synthetase adenylyltransferase [Roseovarius sp.]|nr:glutamine-synthetase adenylyltransferase [Roseovarius sp.]
MTLIGKINRVPQPHNGARGAEARAMYVGLPGDIGELIEGAAGCSPYLHSLLISERDWLCSGIENPESALTIDVPDENIGARLRHAKRRMALITALADLGGAWPLEKVTAALTSFADNAVSVALRNSLSGELRKLPGMEKNDLADACGMIVVAMGKMGAGEMNYSSDIDLVCLHDQSRFADVNHESARLGFIRATRSMVSLLNAKTSEGYVFRTDLRLRPDPAVMPVCISMSAALGYYESIGRNWERAAYIKARICAGDFNAGKRYLESLSPFIWRRYLDYAAMEDIRNMRLLIRNQKEYVRKPSLHGHDMKLGRGGIREIEFFTQALQLICGGRDPDLRVAGTVRGLEKLALNGVVPEKTALALIGHYRFYREVEHRLQMLHDQQTHALPSSDEGFDCLAAFMGRDIAGLKEELKSRIEDVNRITEDFFSIAKNEGRNHVPEGFNEDVIARWRGYPALRSARAVQIFSRLKPEILARLAKSANPNEALLAFDGFLMGLPAGVQVFSLFEARPQLVDLLVDIAGTSPSLAAYLSKNAGVFDAVIDGNFFAEWPGRKALGDGLEKKLASETQYEHKLDVARKWRKEWHFRIGVHHLRGLVNVDVAANQYSDLAMSIIDALWPAVIEQFSIRHGPPPGRGAVVLGMGSLGAGRLNAGSDMDLIIVYDSCGQSFSEGRRPLADRVYYARLTQAMIAALTAPTAEGRLYDVDMRLRPSGNQGPLATSLTAFKEYQLNNAWPWEHLAITRARSITGPRSLVSEIERFRELVLREKGEPDALLKEVNEMRIRIVEAKSPSGTLDPKIGLGRLQEIELVAQAGILLQGKCAREIGAGLTASVISGLLSENEALVLDRSYSLCWKILQATRLLGGDFTDPDKIVEGARAFLLRETGFDTMDALVGAMNRYSSEASSVIDSALSRQFGGNNEQ